MEQAREQAMADQLALETLRVDSEPLRLRAKAMLQRGAE
jgi:hypothetical protein